MRDPTARTTTPLRAATVRRRRVAAKTIRLRDKEHCKFVAAQPCVVCGRTPRRRITFASRKRARSVERSATNTRSPSAGSITGICTATAMRPHGGPGSASIPCRSRSNFGGDRECRIRHMQSRSSPCPTPRLQRRRSIGCRWTTTPGTGSTWPNILKARPLTIFRRLCINRLVESTTLLGRSPAMREIQASEAKTSPSPTSR